MRPQVDLISWRPENQNGLDIYQGRNVAGRLCIISKNPIKKQDELASDRNDQELRHELGGGEHGKRKYFVITKGPLNIKFQPIEF